MPRTSNGNLKPPINKRPTEEQRKIRSMGGKMSAVVRNQKKTFREAFEIALNAKINSAGKFKKVQDLAIDYGFDKDSVDHKAGITAVVMNESYKGNIAAIKLAMDIIGEGTENPESDDVIDKKPFELPARVIGGAYANIYRDILVRRYTYFDFKGGRGSLKSSFCALVLIDEIMRNPDFCAIAIRQVKDTLKDSVYSQIIWAIDELGLTDDFKCTVSPMLIKRKSTGQLIYFRGANEPMKIKSIKPPRNMYIGVLWFEEKDQIPNEETIRSIRQSVLRGGNEIIVLSSYNTPVSQLHYINQDALKKIDKRIIHHSYYYDVPPEWLGQPFFDEAELLKSLNERAYRHEYLGEATGTGANVFENITDKQITDEEIRTFDRILNGVDWGYYPDPWAFVRIYYHSGSRTLYIFDEDVAYKKGNRETAKMIKNKGLTSEDRITADSAEPKSIADYHEYGLTRTFGAEKPAGSVEYSMKWLLSLNAIVIDKIRCPNAFNEFKSYEYEKNKNGDIMTGYPDRNNHLIDAVRYATQIIWKNRETPREYYRG